MFHLNIYASTSCGLADDKGLVHAFHIKVSSLYINYSIYGGYCQLKQMMLSCSIVFLCVTVSIMG